MVGDSTAGDGSSPLVRFDGNGVLRLDDRVIEGIHAELVGGRSRYSVGGQLAEGPRWWRGHLEWTGDDDEPLSCSEVTIELDDGRSAIAVIEADPTAPAHTVAVHGIGPPPFDFP